MTFEDWHHRIIARLAFDMVDAGATPAEITEAREQRELIESVIGGYARAYVEPEAVRPVLRVVAGRDH